MTANARRLVAALSLFLLAGCAPKFSVGDCVVDLPRRDADPWMESRPDRIAKILRVGQKSYKTRIFWLDDRGEATGGTTDSHIKIDWDDLYVATACPKAAR